MSMGDSHSRSERETEWGNRKSPEDRVRLNWNTSHAKCVEEFLGQLVGGYMYLNLTIIVDNSVVEVYANDVTVITTRTYPWLLSSKGAGFLVQNGSPNSTFYYSDMELWDGLINAWPRRLADTRKGLVYDGPLTNGPWNVWVGT